jgi:hypothetical protein
MSSNNFFDRILQDGNARAKYNQVMAATPPNQRPLMKRCGSQYIVNSTTPASGSSASQIMQWRIQQINKIVDRAYLRITFNNGTATVCNFNPFMAIQQIRLLSGNGSQVIANLQGGGLDQLRQFAYLLTESQVANFSQDTNISTVLGLGSGIPASSSRTFILPLWCMPWQGVNDQFSLNFGQNDLILEVTTQDAAQYVEAGTASTLTISNPQLILNVVEPTMEYRNQITAAIRDRTYKFAYVDTQLYTSTQTLNASTEYNFTLSSINGLVATLLIGVYDISTPAGRRTPIAVESYYITDSAGQNILGGNTITSDYNRMEKAQHFEDTLAPRYFNEILESFAERPDLTMKEQIGTGVYYFDGFQRLYLTTPATWTNGSYQVNVSARIYTVLTVDSAGNLVKSSM